MSDACAGIEVNGARDISVTDFSNIDRCGVNAMRRRADSLAYLYTEDDDLAQLILVFGRLGKRKRNELAAFAWMLDGGQ